jgi:hypothetical protein
VGVDVGRAPAKVLQASASQAEFRRVKDESSSSRSTASLRPEQLNCNNEQGMTANKMFASLHKRYSSFSEGMVPWSFTTRYFVTFHTST